MKGLPWIPKTWQLSSGPWRVLDVFELKKWCNKGSIWERSGSLEGRPLQLERHAVTRRADSSWLECSRKHTLLLTRNKGSGLGVSLNRGQGECGRHCWLPSHMENILKKCQPRSQLCGARGHDLASEMQCTSDGRGCQEDQRKALPVACACVFHSSPRGRRAAPQGAAAIVGPGASSWAWWRGRETGQAGALYKGHQHWLAHHPPSCHQRKTPLLV